MFSAASTSSSASGPSTDDGKVDDAALSALVGEAEKEGEKYSGPRVQIRISADGTSVVTSSELIGKAKYSGSAFRHALDDLIRKKGIEAVASVPAGSESDGDSDDTSTASWQLIDSDCPVIEMRFDRSGDTLKPIINAMRGYDISRTLAKWDNDQQFMFFEDCQYYHLPAITAKYKLSLFLIFIVIFGFFLLRLIHHTYIYIFTHCDSSK